MKGHDVEELKGETAVTGGVPGADGGRKVPSGNRATERERATPWFGCIGLQIKCAKLAQSASCPFFCDGASQPRSGRGRCAAAWLAWLVVALRVSAPVRLLKQGGARGRLDALLP